MVTELKNVEINEEFIVRLNSCKSLEEAFILLGCVKGNKNSRFSFKETSLDLAKDILQRTKECHCVELRFYPTAREWVWSMRRALNRYISNYAIRSMNSNALRGNGWIYTDIDNRDISELCESGMISGTKLC